MNKVIKFRCFYRGKMYPVLGMDFYEDGSYSVSRIDMENLPFVNPDSEHVKGITQFIGIQDDFGNEIYFGDIMKWDGDSRKDNKWVIDSFNRTWFSSAGMKAKVIGNIYQNKELINN